MSACIGLCEWTGCPVLTVVLVHVVGGLVVGVAVVTLASATGQPVHSRQALENRYAISLYIATFFKLGWLASAMYLACIQPIRYNIK